MKPTALVVTTVHWPDDTRIRERLIRTLGRNFEVTFATRSPGPSDPSGLDWVPLEGGRLRRNLSVLRVCLRGQWDVLVVHDPELIPAAMASRLVHRRPVVLDVHENIPAIAMTREWVPRALRRPLAGVMRWILRLAERALTITLAEEGYLELFAREHVVFPNYPDTGRYPEPKPGDRSVVYLGDVTAERGARVAVEACRTAGLALTLVGRVGDELRQELSESFPHGPGVRFTGELANPVALEEIRGRGVAISPLLDLPNYRHSAPTKVLEYLALGLPVVASDLPGTRSLVAGLEAVELVTPGDPDLLAAAMLRSLEPEVRHSAARQAPRVRESFRWPGDEVTRFYLSLV